MSTFSAEQLAQILHPQEIEILEEIAYEFEDPDVDEEADAASRPVLSHNLAHLIVQANRNLQGYRGPKSKKAKSKKESKSKKKSKNTDNLSPLDHERFDELGKEIERDEMGTRRLPAVPTRDEVLQMLQAAQAQDRDIDKRDYLIIRLMYATGCRRSELENMRLADMNYKEQRVFVRDGKWDKDRYALIDKKTAELMENFTSHSLRHAYATHLHESGFDLYALKNLMGHRFFTTTKIYIHIAVNNWLEQYERCHPLALGEGF